MSTFRIISFDGGGVKGVLSTRLLKRLCDSNPSLLANTDLFAGTSTGALIALSLANGCTGEFIDNMYSYENIKKIFSKNRINLLRPKFKNKLLKEFLLDVIPADTTIGDLKKYVFVPAFSINGITARHWQGVFFNNITNNSTCNEKVIDAALASSAAPTYFPIHNNYIDGGLITNSPSIASVIVTMHNSNKKYSLSDFRVLSIGTGLTPKGIRTLNPNWGILQWAFRPFTKVKFPLLSILLNDSIKLEDLYCSQLLGKNYFRLNPLLVDDVEIDDYKKVNLLKDCANNYDLEKANLFIKNNFLN